ncbi:UDP-glycosyltransferase family 36 member F1 [Carabus blaptoides fortunei]
MNANYITGVLLAMVAFGHVCQCANILYMSTTPSPSHHIWDKTLAMGLAGRNHKITFFTHSAEKKVNNFTPIVIEGIYEKLAESYNLGEWVNFGPIDSMTGLFEWMNTTCAYDLETPALNTLMAQTKAGVKYDLIIMDMTTGHCLYPVIELFGSPPVVGTSPYGLVQYLSFPFGLDVNIAYNPLNFLPYTDRMSLIERAYNYVYTMFFMYWRQFVYLPEQQKIAEKFFGKDITALEEIERTFSLLLTNTDPDLDYPQAVPPTIIQVGGLHTKRAKSLPENITAPNLLSSIHEVIDNTIYKQNIQAVSKRYRDKPQNALERAIFWVEYVMRHGGTEHLQTAAKHMPFYKTWLLDIWGIIALAVLLTIYTVKQVCHRPNKQKHKIKKN